jgi:hypothetical protein
LNPAEVADALGLSGEAAVDAYLITAGLPGILRSWPPGTPPDAFLRAECSDPAAALFSIPESSLLAEFPAPDQARRVLEAVGSGDRTFANVAATAGNPQGALSSGVLSPLLRRLVEEKRVLASDPPLSTQPGKPALYRIADSNLRLYMAMLRGAQEQSRRGRADAAYKLIQRRWKGWRGRAVEPLVREALEIAALDERIAWPDVQAVGGWWNRQFDPEIDLVGADRRPVAQTIYFVWLGQVADDALHFGGPGRATGGFDARAWLPGRRHRNGRSVAVWSRAVRRSRQARSGMGRRGRHRGLARVKVQFAGQGLLTAY